MAITNKLTAAYLAGLIDGEGRIGIYLSNKKWYRAEIDVGNTCEPVITWLQNSFGGYINTVNENSLTNCKKIYHWQLHNHSVIEKLLKKIYPYLRIKKEQAKLVLQFLKTFDRKNYSYQRDKKGMIKSGRQLNSEIEQLRKKIYYKLKSLNKRGIITAAESTERENALMAMQQSEPIGTKTIGGRSEEFSPVVKNN